MADDRRVMTTQHNDAEPSTDLTHRQRTIIILGLMTGLMLAALDSTIVSAALRTIVGEFGGIDHLSWVFTAYLVASATSMPLFGKISDLYGRKKVYQTAIVIFLIASAMCGAAQNLGQLIAFRTIQGIGGGGLFTLTFTIVGDIVPPRERGRYTGYLSGTFALASVLGPLVGGFLTDEFSWRWVFYVNLPIGAAAFVVTGIVLKIQPRKAEHSLDLAGSALLVTAIVSSLLATVWATEQYGWGAPQTIGLYALAVVALAAFILEERRADEPVLPLRMFSRTGYTAASIVSLLAGAAMYGAIVYLPLFFQGVQGKAAANAGLLLLPLMVSMMFASLISGRLTTRTGHYRIYPMIGTPLAAFGLYLLSTMGPDTGRALSSLWMTVLGAGIGIALPVLTLAVQNTVEFRDLGAGTASVNFFRTIGGTFGLAVFGTVLSRQLDSNLDTNLTGIEVPTGIETADLAQSPTAISQLGEPLKGAVTTALSDSITTTFFFATFVMVAAFIAAAFMREVALRTTTDAQSGTVSTLSQEPA